MGILFPSSPFFTLRLCTNLSLSVSLVCMMQLEFGANGSRGSSLEVEFLRSFLRRLAADGLANHTHARARPLKFQNPRACNSSAGAQVFPRERRKHRALPTQPLPSLACDWRALCINGWRKGDCRKGRGIVTSSKQACRTGVSLNLFFSSLRFFWRLPRNSRRW